MPTEIIEVFTPGQGGGYDTTTDPTTGKPWTRTTATAAVKWAQLHGIDAELSITTTN